MRQYVKLSLFVSLVMLYGDVALPIALFVRAKAAASTVQTVRLALTCVWLGKNVRLMPLRLSRWRVNTDFDIALLLRAGHDPVRAVPVRCLPLARIKAPEAPADAETGALQGGIARERARCRGSNDRRAGTRAADGMAACYKKKNIANVHQTPSQNYTPGPVSLTRAPHCSATKDQEQDQDHHEHQNNDIQLHVVALLGHLQSTNGTHPETPRQSDTTRVA